MKKGVIIILLFWFLLSTQSVYARRHWFSQENEDNHTPTKSSATQPTPPPTQAPGATNQPAGPTKAPTQKMVPQDDSAVREFLGEPTDHPITPTPDPTPTKAPTGQVKGDSSDSVKPGEIVAGFLLLAMIVLFNQNGIEKKIHFWWRKVTR